MYLIAQIGSAVNNMCISWLSIKSSRVPLLGPFYSENNYSRHVTFVENIFPFSALPSVPSPPPVPSVPPPISPPKSLSVTPPIGLPPPTANVPPPPPPFIPHPMITRSQNGITKPRVPLCLHTDTISPLPFSHVQAAKDQYWNEAMNEKYNTIIKRGTFELVPRPTNNNIVRSMWLFRHKC
ncbi:putative mitochondrial protein [Cardamine amara subsp. amara]|uniref:Mitochondrial protein n=1 Tax=Cardamine amara subsp. amara TaxID=228776 RepID=A0ABD1B5N0_CARAN